MITQMLEIETLTDGGQQPLEVARRVAEFIDGAKESLDVAQYDFHLVPETAAVVAGAIQGAAKRGVAVRFLYNVDHRNPIPVPPPPEPDAVLIESLGVPARAIAGVPDLMHHKFAVRDGTTVWTGSTNWTDESWTRQENVIATVESQEVAARYARNFEELWSTGDVERTGFVQPDPVQVDGLAIRPWFTPGYGEELDRKSTRLNSSHLGISYAVFCLKKKKKINTRYNERPLT